MKGGHNFQLSPFGLWHASHHAQLSVHHHPLEISFPPLLYFHVDAVEPWYPWYISSEFLLICIPSVVIYCTMCTMPNLYYTNAFILYYFSHLCGDRTWIDWRLWSIAPVTFAISAYFHLHVVKVFDEIRSRMQVCYIANPYTLEYIIPYVFFYALRRIEFSYLWTINCIPPWWATLISISSL